ncbi:MAG: dihydrolipoamide succinyltransferase, partial [Chloroflexota bacterium]
MTVEEPKTSDAESAASTPEGTGGGTETENATTEVVAAEVAPIEAAPAEQEVGAKAVAAQPEPRTPV